MRRFSQFFVRFFFNPNSLNSFIFQIFPFFVGIQFTRPLPGIFSFISKLKIWSNESRSADFLWKTSHQRRKNVPYLPSAYQVDCTSDTFHKEFTSSSIVEEKYILWNTYTDTHVLSMEKLHEMFVSRPSESSFCFWPLFSITRFWTKRQNSSG